jgi:bifunctional DNase/RNase
LKWKWLQFSLNPIAITLWFGYKIKRSVFICPLQLVISKPLLFSWRYNDPPPRPIVYDLLGAILDGFDVKIEQVLIHSLQEETFYAEIELLKGETRLCLDSRPSDAIALALRVKVPIFVADSVIAEAALPIETNIQEKNVGHLKKEEDLLGSQDTHLDITEQRVMVLRAKLQDVVALEEYEEAAQLRDEIDRLEQALQNR